MPTFPSHEDRKALRRLLQTAGWNLEKAFTEQERYWWHAYDYGWRRVMLGDYRKFSPTDPDAEGGGSGKWFDPALAAVAEKFFRPRLGKSLPKVYPAPSHDEAVRAAWQEIPWPELTSAERALAEREVTVLGHRARKIVDAQTARWRSAFRAPPSLKIHELSKRAKEIPPPLTKEQAKAELDHLNSLLDERERAAE